jgi:hypothetical protein
MCTDSFYQGSGSGSGSTGSTGFFCASGSSKISKKNLDSYCFVPSLKNDVNDNVPSKSKKQKNFFLN